MENDGNLFGNNQSAPNESESKPDVLRLLKFSWGRINRSRNIKCLHDALNGSEPLLGTIGLDGITTKISSYTTLDEYLDDVASLVQGCLARFSENPELTKAVKYLLGNCRRDVESIRKCSECFRAWTEDRLTYFTRACSKPHLLIFAKTPDNPLWPAKVMQIKGDLVNVEFFGDHTQADIPAKDCFLYSERLPGRNTKQENLILAKKELDQHIENIKKRYRTFVPARYRSMLIPEKFEQQLAYMIPGAFDGSASLGSGYDFRTEWVEVQQVRDFDDSVLEVIGSSMGSVHGLANESDGHTSSSKLKKHEAQTNGYESKEKQESECRGNAQETDSFLANRHNSTSQNAIGSNNGATFSGAVQPDSVSSTVIQKIRRARKTFPGPMPKLVQPKRSSQMDHDAVSRKIAKLEKERDDILLQNKKYEEQIAQLNEQLQKNGHDYACATCGKCLGEPYFCNQNCQLNFN